MWEFTQWVICFIFPSVRMFLVIELSVPFPLASKHIIWFHSMIHSCMPVYLFVSLKQSYPCLFPTKPSDLTLLSFGSEYYPWPLPNYDSSRVIHPWSHSHLKNIHTFVIYPHILLGALPLILFPILSKVVYVGRQLEHYGWVSLLQTKFTRWMKAAVWRVNAVLNMETPYRKKIKMHI